MFDAISDIIEYIELHYNQTRIQKDLSYKSTMQVWFNYHCQAAKLKVSKFNYTNLTAGVIK